jgi:hypothetical protein
MDRRLFVRGLFGLAAAAATVTILTPETAEAAPMPVARPESDKTEAERTESDYRPDTDGLPTTEKAQYYYRRRRRRVFYRRRRFVRRRVYYRPRRVFYRRPIYRRPIYRRRYFF